MVARHRVPGGGVAGVQAGWLTGEAGGGHRAQLLQACLAGVEAGGGVVRGRGRGRPGSPVARHVWQAAPGHPLRATLPAGAGHDGVHREVVTVRGVRGQVVEGVQAHAGQVVVLAELAQHLLLAQAIMASRRQELPRRAQPALVPQPTAQHLALTRLHLELAPGEGREGGQLGLLLGFPASSLPLLGGTWAGAAVIWSSGFAILILRNI